MDIVSFSLQFFLRLAYDFKIITILIQADYLIFKTFSHRGKLVILDRDNLGIFVFVSE